ncbi:hypothetical protein EsH8_V_001124 [Colletotrichum jinshuiense]
MAGSLDEEDEDDDKNIESDTERASIVAPQDSSVDDVESISDRDLTTPTTPAAATHFSDAAQIPQDSGKHGDDSPMDIDDSQPTSEAKLPQTSLPYEKSSFIKSQPNDDFSDEGDLFNFDALIPPEIWEDFLPVLKVNPMPQAIATGVPPSAFPGVSSLAAAPIQRLPADYISDFKLARTHSEQLASYATAQKDAEAAALKAKEGEETAKNEANLAREDCKLLNLKLITIAEKASEQERVLKKECASAKDRATELDNHTKRLQALYDQTRDKVSSYEASLRVEKDKIIQLEGQNLALQNKNQALEASAVPREPGNRVTILHVAWAVIDF